MIKNTTMKWEPGRMDMHHIENPGAHLPGSGKALLGKKALLKGMTRYALLCLLLISVGFAKAQSLSVYPASVGATVNCSGKVTRSVTIGNYSTKSLTFSASANLMNPNIAGDYLGNYPNFTRYNRGMVKAGGYIYVNNSDNFSVDKYDITKQAIVSSFEIKTTITKKISLSAITYDGEYLWIAFSNGKVASYTLDGEATGVSFTLPATNVPVLTYDGQYFITANGQTNNTNFYKVDHTGTVISTYTSSDTYLYALTIDPDGNLWSIESASSPFPVIKELSITGSTVKTVNTINFMPISNSYSILHDGNDLYVGYQGTPNLYYYDDGIENGVEWMVLSNTSGTVAPGSSSDVLASFNANGLNSGTYYATITVNSNDPLNTEKNINVTFTVTGDPAITLSAASLNFGQTIIGAPLTQKLTIGNTAECGVLQMSGITSTHTAFTVDNSSFNVKKGDSIGVTITFNPTSLGTYSDSLVLSYNGMDTIVALSASCIEPPVLSVTSADTLFANVSCSGTQTNSFTISNNGVAGLKFTNTAYSEDKIELSEALEKLDNQYNEITSLIPQKHTFTDGISGNNIDDGGNDMYDNGNYLNTDISSQFSYSDGTIVNGGAMGTNGSYFTRKYNGLFILAANLDGVGSFYTSGDNGADGSGSAEGSVLTVTAGGVTYLGFVKRVFNAGDPSINQIVIVKKNNLASHTFSTNTNNDSHTVSDLSQSNQLFYLLYAGTSGYYIDDAHATAIMSKFLEILAPDANFISFAPKEGTVEPGNPTSVSVGFNGANLITGKYTGGVVVSSNDLINSTVTIPYVFTVNGSAEINLSSISFDQTIAGASTSDTLLITNTGCDTLKITDIANSASEFNVNKTALAILPYQSAKVLITFSPSVVGGYNDTLVIVSNTANDTLFVNGTSISSPILAVTPDTIEVSVTTCGGTTTGSFTIANNLTGSSTQLEYNCTFEGMNKNPGWLTLSDTAGTVAAGASTTITGTFSANVNAGIHQANVIISSNDANNTSDTVICLFTVTGESNISLSASSLNMSSFVGYNATDSIWVSNSGCDTLKVIGFSGVATGFSVNPSAFNVLPDDSAKVIVTFAPTVATNYSAAFSIENNSANPVATLSVSGTGIAAPHIAMNTDSIIESVTCSATADSVFTIANTGDGTLTYTNTTFADAIFDADNAGNLLETYTNSYNNGGERGMVLVGGYLYIAGYDNSQVVKYDFTNQEIVETYNMNFEPYGITYDGTYLWIGEYDNGIMYAYDLTLNAIGISIDLPVPDPVITYDGKYFVVANRWNSNPTIYKVDHSGNIIESFTSDFDRLNDFTWVPQHNSGHLWAVDNDSYLEQIDLNKGTANTIRTIGFNYSITAMAHDGTDLLCGNQNNDYVYRVDDGYNENLSWISLSATSGTIAPGSPNVEITATLNGEGLVKGTYNGGIVVATNDPDRTTDTIYCKFMVEGQASLDLSSHSFAFNNAFLGSTTTDTLWGINSGCDTLKITGIANTTGEFSVDQTSFNVLPNGSAPVVISFHPSSVGSFKDTLFIANNVLNDTVFLSAIAVAPPVFALDTNFIADTLFACGNVSGSQSFTIHNNGVADLNYTIGQKNTKIEVLALTYGVDYAQEYTNTIDAINQYFTNYNLTEISTTDASQLETALEGKNTLLIAEQENGTPMVFTSFSIVLQNFVNNGGNVIFCGTNNYNCITNTGLLNITGTSNYTGDPLTINNSSHVLTNGLVEPYIASNGTYPATITNGDRVNLVTLYGQTVVGYRTIGLGKAIFIAHDYYAHDDNGARVIANAVQWGVDNRYCDLSSYSGTINAGNSNVITATFNPDNMESGTYTGNIIISSNDPLNTTDTVAYSFTIDGEPVMEMSTNNISFPEVPLNSNTSYTPVEITNTGCDTLFITGISSDISDFYANTSSLSVLPNSSESIYVYFAPQDFGVINGTLTLYNNYNTDTVIYLTGTGAQTKVVSVVTNTPDGYYNAGDIIDLVVRYNGNINFTSGGTPATIELNTNPVTYATFKETNGRDAIFEYTVGAGENSSALDYVVDTIKMNDTQFLDDNANNVSHNLPAIGTFALLYNIVIDNIQPSVAISSATSNPTNVTPIDLTITFSEAVQSFTSSDIVLTNGTISGFTAVSDSSWIVAVAPLANGNITMNIAAGVAADLAGNSNTAAGEFSIEYDAQLPVLALSSTVNHPTNSNPIVVTVISNVAVTGLEVADFIVTNGTASNLTTVAAGIKWNINITPASNGNISVKLPAGSVINSNNNSNSDDALFAARYDGTAPAFAITTTNSNPTNVAPIAVTIALSEVATGFDASDVTVTNGTVSNFTAVSNVLWTLNVIPTDNGTVSVSIAAGVVSDSATNTNAAKSLSVIYDGTTPTVAITSSVANPTNANPIAVAITFSETVKGFAASDISVTNGSVSGLQTTDSITFIANVTPVADGLVTLNITDSVAYDLAGNANAEAAPFSVTYDGTVPSVAITSLVANPTNSASIEVTITFNEVVKGFGSDDIIVSNGSVSGLSSVDYAVYKTTIIPSADGIVNIVIAAEVATDAAGNANTAADQFSLTYDGTAPTIAIASSVANPTNANPIAVTITFSELVKGFAASDISVTNGSVSGLTTTDSIAFEATLAPAADGLVSVDVAAAVAIDAAGNANTTANQFSLTYDAIAPSVAITSAVTNLTNANPIDVTITFSETVKGFAASDISVTNGSVSGLTTTDSIAFEAALVPAADGLVSVDVADAVTNDAAGNGNTAADQFGLTYDGTAPSVVITSTVTNLTNANPIAVTITFSETVKGFAASDISVTNGSVSGLTTTDSIAFEAALVPAADGLVSVDVAAAVANDAAGNGNSAAVQFSLTYDGILPQVITLASSNITNNSATIAFTANKAGKLYYAVLVKGATVPTVSQIIDGSITVVTSGELTVEEEVQITSDLTGLNAETTYTVYAVVVDALQSASEIKALDFTTLTSSITDENVSINLFPNPVINQLNVNLNQSVEGVKYCLYAINGQKVDEGFISGQSSTIDMANLSQGTYTLQLMINGKVSTFKVIKQ